MKRRLIPLMVALATGFSPVFAVSAPSAQPPAAEQQFDKGVAAAQRGDFSAAYGLWRPLADQGNAPSQFNLGIMYHHGEGVPQDLATALGWYRKAADQGMASAQFNLGTMYSKGQGVARDDAVAIKWFLEAADQGHAGAQSNLGVMYETGMGAPQDAGSALSWYRKAADQGDATAQLNLAHMYERGRGAPQDYVQAHKWYNLSAAGATQAEVRDVAAKSRDVVAGHMTPSQIAEAQRLAAAWRGK